MDSGEFLGLLKWDIGMWIGGYVVSGMWLGGQITFLSFAVGG